MSYILDALRKSEQQRLQQSVPTLGQAALGKTAEPVAGQRRLWFLLAAALLLIGGIAIGSLRPWQVASPAGETVAAVYPSRPPVESPPVMTTPVPPPEIAPVAPAAPMPHTPAAATPAPPSALPALPATSPPAPVVTTAIKPTMPAAASLPPITITVHAYSATPKERLAGINGKLLQEGELVAPGLKLEKITEDGVILNFQGQRFRRQI